MIIRRDSNNFLSHYGILRKSGRFPWGSGVDRDGVDWGTHKNATEVERGNAFMGRVAQLKAQGLTDKEIYDGWGMTSTEFRDARSVAVSVVKQDRINNVEKLRAKGMSTTEIGKQLGIPEPTVRGYLQEGAKDRASQLTSIANHLREKVDELGVVEVGLGVSNQLKIAPTKLRAAISILKDEGYKFYKVQLPQIGGSGSNKTTATVIARPEFEYVDIKKDLGLIKSMTGWTNDGGSQFFTIQPPISVGLKRIDVKYAEQGGKEADGVIYVRPGAKDLDMGGNQYAQVRIMVNGTHYLKGMAVLKDDLPAGVDLQFNTNKSNTGNKLDAMKPLKRAGVMKDKDGKTVEDPDSPVDLKNPFGAVVRQIPKKDANGNDIKNTVKSALNLVNEAGDWEKWKKSVSSQVLSKQPPALARQQLALTRERRENELREIMALTNPVVKKKLLDNFADETDSAAVDLKAANLPGQASHVILPVNSMKPTEIHAPNYPNGTTVALVRYPHGGIFEIPELKVNNNNREANAAIGKQSRDAVGIHHSVAERLSGADFDGDTVLVIPQQPGMSLRTKSPLQGLKDFDPQVMYKLPAGVEYKKHKQSAMGDISNLITDMTIKGASDDKIARAVRHSMVVIDADKHKLNWKQSELDNNISALKIEFQGGATRGAATLVSRSGSTARISEQRERKASDIPYATKLKREGASVKDIAEKMKLSEDSVKELLRPGATGGKVDPDTGAIVYLKTGQGYTKTKVNEKTGEVTTKYYENLTSGKKLALTDDARTLLSEKGGTEVEKVYATHSNALKSMANQARKESLKVDVGKKDPAAAVAFSKEVESLKAKLDLVNQNKPKQRQALALANAEVAQRLADNPELARRENKTELQKMERLFLKTAQERTGAKKTEVEITPQEWNAIQSKAVSPRMLKDILDSTDIKRVKELATPRTKPAVSDAMMSRAKRMADQGFTQQEIAATIGVPLGTLKEKLYS